MKIQPRLSQPQFGAFSAAQKQALSAVMASTDELLTLIAKASQASEKPDSPTEQANTGSGEVTRGWSETLTRLDHELGSRLFGMDPEAGVLTGLLKTIQEMPAYIPSANTFDKLLQRVKETVGRKKGGNNGYVDPQFKQLTETITQIAQA